MQTCPNCKAQNVDTAQFCISCGEPQLGLLPFGEVLQGRYRIDDLLGCGGFGAVYKAADLRLGVIVAVKENLQPQAIQAFLTEAKLLATLKHDHLPKVTDYFAESSGRQYLVMEFVDGEPLDALVRRKGKLNEQEALDLFKGVFEAVAYLHSRNPPVIHRDIKPQNIIVQGKKAVLVDFGIAKLGGVGTRTSTIGQQFGSPGFAPLEQYVGSGETDERTDIYALAATLYFCLTGLVPPEAMALGAGVATLTPLRQLNPSVSAAVETAVMKGMALQKMQRFNSVQDFWRELTVRTLPVKLFSMSSLRLRRSLIVALGLILLSFLAWFILRPAASNWMTEKGDKIIGFFFKIEDIDVDACEEAINAYNWALWLNPKNERAWYGKGLALTKLKRYREALSAYNHAFEVDHSRRGKLRWEFWIEEILNLNRYREVLDACNHALKIHPRYKDAWIYKGRALIGLKRYHEALTAFTRALEIDPQDSRACFWKGYVYGELGRYSEAVAAYNRVLEIDPNDSAALNNKGVALQRLGRYREALQCYDEAARMGNPFAAKNAESLRQWLQWREAERRWREQVKALQRQLQGSGVTVYYLPGR